MNALIQQICTFTHVFVGLTIIFHTFRGRLAVVVHLHSYKIDLIQSCITHCIKSKSKYIFDNAISFAMCCRESLSNPRIINYLFNILQLRTFEHDDGSTFTMGYGAWK